MRGPDKLGRYRHNRNEPSDWSRASPLRSYLARTVLGTQPPKEPPHILSLFPSLFWISAASLFHPSCHPQQHHFLSNRSFKEPQDLPATSTQPPQQQTTRRFSETLLQSSVATPLTPQYNPSPQVTPKTSSLCQAQPRSRISRAAVSPYLPTVLFCFFWNTSSTASAIAAALVDVTLPMDLFVLLAVGPSISVPQQSNPRPHLTLCVPKAPSLTRMFAQTPSPKPTKTRDRLLKPRSISTSASSVRCPRHPAVA